MKQYEDALLLAADAHGAQRRKYGEEEAYINHPIRVAAAVDDEDMKVVALLHDVLEDTSAIVDYVDGGGMFVFYGGMRLHLKPEQALALIAVTRMKNETYSQFIERVAKSGENAIRIKLADINDNQSTLPEGHGLHDRYYKARATLKRELRLIECGVHPEGV